MFGGSGIGLADIAAVVDRNDGMNGGNAWWVIILILALCGGFGNNWGNNGRQNDQNAYDTQAAVQRGFDTQTIVSKLDGINSGICSLGYDQLAQMNGINANIMQTGFANQQAINGVAVAAMQNTNALSTQLANCCCENRQGQADIKYALATDTCAITTAVNQAAQNIMQNDNANYRQLHDEMTAVQMQALKDRIADQQSLIQSLNLAQSQANQNNYIQSQIEGLYDRLSPCPRPAYWVQNPNCCQNPWGPFGANFNGFNNGGCCNNGSCC